jgi:hypothetical protein
MLDKSLWDFIKGQVCCTRWRGVQSCGTGIHKYYATDASVHGTQNMVVYESVFWTRWCTYGSTWCGMTLATWYVK